MASGCYLVVDKMTPACYIPLMQRGAGRVTGTGFRPESRGFESLRLQSAAVESKPMSAVARVLPFLADDAQPVPVKVETTHEAFVHAVRAAVAPRVVSAADRGRV